MPVERNTENLQKHIHEVLNSKQKGKYNDTMSHANLKTNYNSSSNPSSSKINGFSSSITTEQKVKTENIEPKVRT